MDYFVENLRVGGFTLKALIIGGGIAGLTAGYLLSQNDINVTIVEKERELGGLARSYHIGDEHIPYTYHHILPSDKHLLELLSQLNLEVKWKRVKIGFHKNGRNYPFNTPLDLLKFKPLSFLDRIRLGILVLKAKNTNEDLLNVSVKDWVTKNAGKGVFDSFIDYMVSSYYGSSKDVSAQYLVNRWKTESLDATNRLGHVDIWKLINVLKKKILDSGGQIILGKEVLHVKNLSDVIKTHIEGNQPLKSDIVISTIPPPVFSDIYSDGNFVGLLRSVKYKCVICITLMFEHITSDYYWLIMLDDNCPFISCFEYSNLNPNIKKGVVYLVAYCDEPNTFWTTSNIAVVDRFLLAYYKSSINYDGDNLFLNYRVFKHRWANPVFRVGYEFLPIKLSDRIYLAGMGRIFPDIRCMGSSVRTAQELAKKIRC